MSDDIFVRRGMGGPRRSSAGPAFVGIVVLGAAALGAAWYLRRTHETTGSSPAPVETASSLPPAAPAPSGNGPVAALPGPATVPGAPASPGSVPSARTPAVPSATVAPIESDPALAVFTEARQIRDAGDLAGALEKSRSALETAANPVLRRAIETLIGEIHTALVFSPAPLPEKIDYTIQPGDSLAAIARKNGTTVELLQKGNNLRGAVIRPGDRLRILNGVFSLVVDKSANDLVLSLNKRFFKRYTVGTGKYQKTPTGTFKLTDRIAQPTWFRPDGKPVPYGDKENVLGTHWLSLDVQGYGIHGTWEPETVGKQESAGCVRMVNQDIEELFTLLPVGTEVVIQE